MVKKSEIADRSVSENVIENKKIKWYSRSVKEAIHMTKDFILTISTGTVELKFLKRGCLQSDNMTTDLYRSAPLREQFPPLTISAMLGSNPPTMSEVRDTPINNKHDGTNSSTH